MARRRPVNVFWHRVSIALIVGSFILGFLTLWHDSCMQFGSDNRVTAQCERAKSINRLPEVYRWPKAFSVTFMEYRWLIAWAIVLVPGLILNTVFGPRPPGSNVPVIKRP